MWIKRYSQLTIFDIYTILIIQQRLQKHYLFISIQSYLEIDILFIIIHTM